jgi:hypothetical protein
MINQDQQKQLKLSKKLENFPGLKLEQEVFKLILKTIILRLSCYGRAERK